MNRKKYLGLLLAGLASLVGATAAPAFDFSGCGLFEMIAFDKAVFENSQHFTDLKGDVFVISPTGFIKTGQNNTFGALFANTIFMQAGSTANFCFGTVVGTGTCVHTGPFVAPPGCSVGPFPLALSCRGLPDPAFCVPGTAVEVTVDQALAPGCYKSIKVFENQTLTLARGRVLLHAGRVPGEE